MRQKFGASNGLRSGSGGGMAGIGSDPNYRPGQSGGSGHSRGKYSILCVFFSLVVVVFYLYYYYYMYSIVFVVD